MNILDENIPESQRLQSKRRRIPVRQIGLDAGRSGMDDAEIPSLLHSLDRPTFFTLDADFNRGDLHHPGIASHFWMSMKTRRPSSSFERFGIVISTQNRSGWVPYFGFRSRASRCLALNPHASSFGSIDLQYRTTFRIVI